MTTSEKQNSACRQWISPLRLTLLAVNAVCFGGCLVLLALATVSGALIVLTIGTGLSLGAGLAGAVTASRKSAARDQGK